MDPIIRTTHSNTPMQYHNQVCSILYSSMVRGLLLLLLLLLIITLLQGYHDGYQHVPRRAWTEYVPTASPKIPDNSYDILESSVSSYPPYYPIGQKV